MFIQFLIGGNIQKAAPARTTSSPRISGNDESLLLSAALRGEEHAFTSLVRRHHKMVFNLALDMAGSREDAEEIAQDAFVKAFRYLKSYRGESSFKTWLYRVARSAALDHLRRKRLDTVSLDAAGSPVMKMKDSAKNGLQITLSNEQSDLIKQAMHRLSAADETALQLFYFHDQSVEEISTTMGWTSSNTKSRLSRARQRLRSILTEQFAWELQ